MPQAIKIGNSVFQVDDAGLGSAIDQQLSRHDSLVSEHESLKLKLDALETAKATIETQLTEVQNSLAEAQNQKTKADADIVALQTKLDAAMKKTGKTGDTEEDEEAEDSTKESKSKEKPKMDSDEIRSYCQEFLAVINAVSPILKKADSAFEPDFSRSPLDYKAQYLKTIETLPAEAKARIDSNGDDRDAFVNHLYIALKPQAGSTSESAPTKVDEGTQSLADAIDKNRTFTVDASDKTFGIKPKEDSPTMEARKKRKLPSAYSK